MTSFSARIRELRTKQEGLKQSDVAAAVGVSTQSYSTYENGREPSYEILVKLASYYDVTIDYLLGKSGAQKPENALLSDSLGLSDKGIELIRTGFNEPINEDPVRTKKDVFGIMLEDDYFSSLVEYIGVVTTPHDHWSASQWNDGPLTPHYMDNNADPRKREKEAAYKQFAHEALDMVIQHVGQKSVESYLSMGERTNEEKDKP